MGPAHLASETLVRVVTWTIRCPCSPMASAPVRWGPGMPGASRRPVLTRGRRAPPSNRGCDDDRCTRGRPTSRPARPTNRPRRRTPLVRRDIRRRPWWSGREQRRRDPPRCVCPGGPRRGHRAIGRAHPDRDDDGDRAGPGAAVQADCGSSVSDTSMVCRRPRPDGTASTHARPMHRVKRSQP